MLACLLAAYIYTRSISFNMPPRVCAYVVDRNRWGNEHSTQCISFCPAQTNVINAKPHREMENCERHQMAVCLFQWFGWNFFMFFFKQTIRSVAIYMFMREFVCEGERERVRASCGASIKFEHVFATHTNNMKTVFFFKTKKRRLTTCVTLQRKRRIIREKGQTNQVFSTRMHIHIDFDIKVMMASLS